MAKNNTIMGMDQSLLDHIITLQKYEDALVRLPNRHQVMLKVLGPIYKTYLKVQMATQSTTQAYQSQVKTTNTLAKATAGLLIPLTATAAIFKGIGMSLFPLVGMIVGIMGAMMLLVAIFDQGGGALRAWLEEIPIIGTVFEALQSAVDMVKGLISGEGDGGMFAPIADAATSIIGNIITAWETLTSLFGPIDGEAIFGAVFTILGGYISFYSNLIKTVVDMFVTLFVGLADSGALTAIMDGLSGLFEALMFVWTFVVESIFGEGSDGFSAFFDGIASMFAYLVDFLNNSGIFLFIGEVIGLAIDIVSTIIIVVAAIIGVIVKAVKFIWPFIEPYFRIVINYWGMIATVVMAVVNTILKVIRGVLAFLRGDLDGASKHFTGILDVWEKALTSLYNFFMGWVEGILDFIQPVIDAIEYVVDGIESVGGGIVSGIGGFLGFSKGGVASGPSSGYPVTLHGTEAIVPLPDGRSIPVVMQGMGGGGSETNTINITVNGANGDASKLARMISDEVGRAFKNRSRNGGFSRGV